MAAYKEGKEDIQTEQEQVHKIRITITSKNCSAIERISNELVKAAKDKQLKVKVNQKKLPRKCTVPNGPKLFPPKKSDN
jgi:ribosomal protein S10